MFGFYKRVLKIDATRKSFDLMAIPDNLYQWDELATIIRGTTGLELDEKQMGAPDHCPSLTIRPRPLQNCEAKCSLRAVTESGTLEVHFK